MNMLYTKEELRVLEISLFAKTSDTKQKKSRWQRELQELLPEEDRVEWAYSGPSELLTGSPLPWPEDHLEEIKKERRDAIIKAQKAYEYSYGDDDRIMDLICDESEVDLRMALWRSDRVLEIENLVLEFCILYDEGKFLEVVTMAAWLVPEHEKYDMDLPTQLSYVLRMSEEHVLESGVGRTDVGDVSDIP